jgi:hypothetical protein
MNAPSPREHWTDAQIYDLGMTYRVLPAAKIAEAHGRTKASVCAKARREGLSVPLGRRISQSEERCLVRMLRAIRFAVYEETAA